LFRFSVLLCKWQYFYKPQVHQNGSNGVDDPFSTSSPTTTSSSSSSTSSISATPNSFADASTTTAATITKISINSTENLHPEHFMSIMNAYGQTLVTGCDPSIVRSVLLSMQQVNERWRLYQRNLFKEHLLSSFQIAVINLLLSGEGLLHYDLLTNTLYALGQIDKYKLRESFITTTNHSTNIKTIDEVCLSAVSLIRN